MHFTGGAGGTAAVGRTLATTICRIVDPMLVARPRQLRDAATVMRSQPAHQSMINRRFDGCTSRPARNSANSRFKESHEFTCLLLQTAGMKVVQIIRLIPG
jgi:hypothetical protein